MGIWAFGHLGIRRFDGAAYAQLTQRAKIAVYANQAWLYLEAAHVVGQLLRLALVPLGNLSGRLPLSNSGGFSLLHPSQPRPQPLHALREPPQVFGCKTPAQPTGRFRGKGAAGRQAQAGFGYQSLGGGQ